MSIAKLAPWRSQPLSEAAKKAKFRQVMDLRAESVLLGRSAIIAGWIIGAVGLGAGMAMLGASITGWMYVLSHQPPPQFYEVDHSTGIIAVPVSISDAPSLFSESTDHQELKRYINACEEWVPEMDRHNYRLCMLMSSPDQQARYAARRAKPTHPAKAIGLAGHVENDNYRFHQQAIDQKSGTRRYWVQFDRTVYHGTKADPTKAWSITVDFQYHPELPMIPADRVDNKSGFQAISSTPNQDTPETTPTMEAK